jgi:FkbM family methyltransferase
LKAGSDKSMKAHTQVPINSDPSPAIAPVCANALARFMRGSPQFRGKARLQEWLLPSRGVIRARVFGYEVELDLSDVIQRDIYAGTYEPFEARYLRSFLRPGMRVVDIGANIGYYTLLAASRVGPDGKVLSFEPGPYAYERLARAIRENGIAIVECRPVALGDNSGTATLYVPRESEGNYNPSLSPYLPNMLTVEVPVERLDEALDRSGESHIDLMKVDVEGHELEVFRGGERWLRGGRVRAVLCEFNAGYQEGAGASCQQLEAWFGDAGFRLEEQFPSKWGAPVHNRLYVRAA